MRDNFTSKTKYMLARRVGFHCSNPDCRMLTVGPGLEVETTVNIGVAAHITAAAPSGSRYDPLLKPSQRKAAENGIWLCQNCAKLIDADEIKFSADTLHAWKQQAEMLASEEMGRVLNLPKPESVTAIIHYNAHYTPLYRKEIIQQFPEFEFTSVHEFPSNEALWTNNQWEFVKERERKYLLDLLKNSDLPSTFLIYSINFLPLIIHLGFQFTARKHTRVFQYHRGQENPWRWEPRKDGSEISHILIDNSFMTGPPSGSDLLFIVEISSSVALEDCQKVMLTSTGVCRIYVNAPGEDWLRFQEQLDEFQHCITRILAQIRKWGPHLERIHVFFAGPAPCAFVFGQAINPTMTPAIHLYNFNARDDPKYRFAFQL